MGVESSIGSKVLLRHVISILTIISLEGWVPVVSLTYGSCESDECGKVMIGYPFGNDSQPCCPQDRLLKLNSLWKDPIVYDDQSLGLISESGRTGNACFAPPEKSPQPPSASHADVPGSKVLSFLKSNRGGFHLAFLRNCNGSPNGDYSHPDLTCLSAGANHSYVTLGGRPDDLHLSRLACESHVIVPVELAGEDWEKIENDESAKEELKHGFRLQWNLTFWESCVKCKISGGKCGELDGSFLCKCSDKAYLNTCKRALSAKLSVRVMNKHFQNCSITRTFGGHNITFPFFILDQQPSYCGFPGFELACIDSSLILNLSGDDLSSAISFTGSSHSASPTPLSRIIRPSLARLFLRT